PKARAYVFNVTPRQLLRIAGDAVPGSYRRRLENYRYVPGVVKMGWALRGPVPWSDPRSARGTAVHLSGTLGEGAAVDRASVAGAMRVLAPTGAASGIIATDRGSSRWIGRCEGRSPGPTPGVHALRPFTCLGHWRRSRRRSERPCRANQGSPSFSWCSRALRT